jgi:sugar phosphate isomerase/epimerase
LRKADVERLVGSGLRVANVSDVSPFRLDDASSFEPGRERVRKALLLAELLGAPHLALTTGPAGALEWDDAADALATALDPVLDPRLCIEHTNALRVDVGFVHTLRDAIDLARRLDVNVCMEVNACWAERDLAATIVDGVDRIAIVQVSDFAVGTLSTPNRLVPGGRRHPAAPHHRPAARCRLRGRVRPRARRPSHRGGGLPVRHRPQRHLAHRPARRPRRLTHVHSGVNHRGYPR